MEKTKIDLQNFYPELLHITGINETDTSIEIQMKSLTKECACPNCGVVSKRHRGTFVRKIQDIPLFKKALMLHVNIYEYACDEAECNVTSFTETFKGFLNYYTRKTERLSELICAIALETSCEGCARICKEMGIKISGDSIIRLLIKKYESQSVIESGSVIGVDDFAFAKRKTYGTVVVDEATHQPVALLEGRDKATLKEWLEHNKHIKAVTRDRANSYSAAIEEVLPEAMQIADRFHLHQNLLEIVSGALNGNMPSTIKVPLKSKCEEENVKKTFS